MFTVLYMRKVLFFAAAFAVSLSLCSCGQKYETVQGDPLETKIYTLDNGLKVFMSVNKEQPRIQTYIAVKVGSKNDPSETTGLAHYFEHLMFKGTQQFGTSDYAAEKPMLDSIESLFETYRGTQDEAERAAIYRQIDSVSYEASKLSIPNEYDKLMAIIGADGTNAWTSSDETVYTEDIPSNQIDNWARIQADRFRNVVIRGFHTELETIYEEKNMSLTQDNRKLWEALDKSLFPHHPYGQQTTLGSQEHLKNPSITNVKKYHDVYYVPNNIAICVSGDFNPDEMVAAIEKYFGDWEPNPSVPQLKFEKEQEVTSPIVTDVYGLEAEMLAMGWRLPGASDLKTAAIAEIASSILSNGRAGLIDIDVNQQQKALYLSAGANMRPDYGMFIVMGRPKQGQTMEQLKDISLEELAKLRAGDFDEALISATVNNIKLAKMRSLENNSSRAQQYVDAFINGVDWKDAARELERYEAVTKDDVVAFAKKYLADNSCAIVYKRQGEDKEVQKIAAPKITPIVTNRDNQSAFLKEIQATKVKPVAPVFVNFSKDMSAESLTDGVNLLYKRNEQNDIFTLEMVFNFGTENCPFLGTAFDYLDYLGTPTRSAEDIASSMYALACDFSFSAGTNKSVVSLTGLSENMGEALGIVEDLILNAKADEDILANVKSDLMRMRTNNKKSQRSCYSALSRYVYYGGDFIKRNSLSDSALLALTSEELLAKVREVFGYGHEILYYGPESRQDLRKTLAASHKVGKGAVALPEVFTPKQTTKGNEVVMAQYDAAQIYYFQYSDRGEKFDPSSAAAIDLYNEYFGGGMNTVVFQEMREARGLAYSAWARLYTPSFASDTYPYVAFIATQNDKMRQAIEAFEEIINDMPQSEAAFSVAKDALLSRMRTQRTTGLSVLEAYRDCRRLGIAEPLDRIVFEKVQGMTLDDVIAAQQKWVKGRDYTYAILGDIKDLDTRYLSTLGPVKTVTLEDIFGY